VNSFNRSFKRIGDILENFIKYIEISLFLISLISISFEVFMRYVLNSPTSWSEELARFTMVWLTMLGLGVAVRWKEHIRVDNVVDIFPEKMQHIAAWLRFGFVLIFSLVLVIEGIRLIMLNLNQITPGLNIPMGVVYLSVPIGAGLIIFYLVEQYARGDRETF